MFDDECYTTAGPWWRGETSEGALDQLLSHVAGRELTLLAAGEGGETPLFSGVIQDLGQTYSQVAQRVVSSYPYRAAYNFFGKNPS